MTATTLIDVTIPDTVRSRPEWNAAVLAATREYEKRVSKRDLYQADRHLEWKIEPADGGGEQFILRAREHDEYGDRTAERIITPAHMLDTVARNAAVSDVYMDILSVRFDQANARIIDKIRELQEAEVADGARR